MKVSLQELFNEFKEKIIECSYHPTTAIETLKARLAASWLLQHSNPWTVRQAETFIQKTSVFKEADLSRLQQLSAQIKTWDEFHICSADTNSSTIFLEYKLSFTNLHNQKQILHFHAQFEIKKDLCYFVSQAPPLIRVVGDPILHKPGALFPQVPTEEQQQELTRQIEHAQSILIQTGGAGIAANQCAGINYPYLFSIVGVFYDIPEHVKGVEKRYPNTKFPQAKIMVNPVIIATSQETQHFNHGCLSVPCANRCTVLSPMEIGVSYQDPMEEMMIKQITFAGVDAVVLWHELTHILSGKTYMDVTFESLPSDDLYQFRKMVSDELQNRQENHHHLPSLSVPPFHLSVKLNDAEIPRLDNKELAHVLPKMTEETLAGLFNQVSCLLKKKPIITNDLLKGLSVLSIYSAENRRNQFDAEQTSKSVLSRF